MSLSPDSGHVWTATGREPPVFLDEHGRRRRWVALGGALAGGAAALWLGALVAGAIGFSTMPALQSRSPLVASRTAPAAATGTLPVAAVRTLPVPAVRVPPRRRRSRPSHADGSSTLAHATELAVSRGPT